MQHRNKENLVSSKDHIRKAHVSQQLFLLQNKHYFNLRMCVFNHSYDSATSLPNWMRVFNHITVVASHLSADVRLQSSTR